MELSTITKEQLIEFGMTETEGIEVHITPLRKVIGKSEDTEHGDLSIVITREYNTDALALKLPDGGTLFLTCKTIEELKAFEKCIGMWTPAY